MCMFVAKLQTTRGSRTKPTMRLSTIIVIKATCMLSYANGHIGI